MARGSRRCGEKPGFGASELDRALVGHGITEHVEPRGANGEANNGKRDVTARDV